MLDPDRRLSHDEWRRRERHVLAHRAICNGLLLNSALYLASVVVIGLVKANPLAWQCGVAAFGVTYVSYYLQLAGARERVSTAVVLLSIGLGIVAGLALLVR